MSEKKAPTISIGELKERLELFPNNFELSFSCLEFYRLKVRDSNVV